MAGWPTPKNKFGGVPLPPPSNRSNSPPGNIGGYHATAGSGNGIINPTAIMPPPGVITPIPEEEAVEAGVDAYMSAAPNNGMSRFSSSKGTDTKGSSSKETPEMSTSSLGNTPRERTTSMETPPHQRDYTRNNSNSKMSQMSQKYDAEKNSQRSTGSRSKEVRASKEFRAEQQARQIATGGGGGGNR